MKREKIKETILTGSVEEEVCKNCNGKGWMLGECSHDAYDCPICNGNGEAIKTKQKNKPLNRVPVVEITDVNRLSIYKNIFRY